MDVPEMGQERLAHGAVFQIDNVKFLAGGFDQLINGRIVHMADAREKMVLHLKIEPAK